MANGIASVYTESALRAGQYAPLELFGLWTKIHQFFCPMWKALSLIKFFSDVQYVDCRSVPETFAIKVKGVRNRAEIWTFSWPSQIFGAAFQKFYKCYHPCLAAHHLKKFREHTPTNPKVMRAHTQNFRANFNFLQLNFWGYCSPHCGVG